MLKVFIRSASVVKKKNKKYQKVFGWKKVLYYEAMPVKQKHYMCVSGYTDFFKIWTVD